MDEIQEEFELLVEDNEHANAHQLLAGILAWNGRADLDSQEAARAIMDAYGELINILPDPLSVGRRDPDLDREDVALLSLYAALFDRYFIRRAQRLTFAVDFIDIHRLLFPFFLQLPIERAYALFRRKDGTFLGGGLAARGGIDTVTFSAHYLIHSAWQRSADEIILAHNHPNGIRVFSIADLVATCTLDRALSEAGLRLVDHYVYADQGIHSLREQLELADTDPWRFPPEAMEALAAQEAERAKKAREMDEADDMDGSEETSE